MFQDLTFTGKKIKPADTVRLCPGREPLHETNSNRADNRVADALRTAANKARRIETIVEQRLEKTLRHKAQCNLLIECAFTSYPLQHSREARHGTGQLNGPQKVTGADTMIHRHLEIGMFVIADHEERIGRNALPVEDESVQRAGILANADVV